MDQSCVMRSVTYQTWCENCKKMEEQKLEDGESGRGAALYTYIGETLRSCFEREREHQKDAEQLNTGIHILKHIVEKHVGEDPGSVEFRMRSIKYHHSAFERQIFESVKIQSVRTQHILLNSKSE